MLSTWWKTLHYARLVRGYDRASASTLIARQGGVQSDMFRLALPKDHQEDVSLADYHAAFLTSPLFQIELWILSTVQGGGSGWKETFQRSHLQAVAQGDHGSVGPWRHHAVEGDVQAKISPLTTPPETAVTRIMRCHVRGEAPFCDTWWSVERTAVGEIDLVFGTDIRRHVSPQGGWTSRLINLTMPLHNVYSRLLLASAYANLVARQAGTTSSRPSAAPKQD